MLQAQLLIERYIPDQAPRISSDVKMRLRSAGRFGFPTDIHWRHHRKCQPELGSVRTSVRSRNTSRR